MRRDIDLQSLSHRSFSRPLDDTWLPLPSYGEDYEAFNETKCSPCYDEVYGDVYILSRTCVSGREKLEKLLTQMLVWFECPSLLSFQVPTVPLHSPLYLLDDVCRAEERRSSDPIEDRVLSEWKRESCPDSEISFPPRNECALVQLLVCLIIRHIVQRSLVNYGTKYISVLYCQYYYTYSARKKTHLFVPPVYFACNWSRLSKVPVCLLLKREKKCVVQWNRNLSRSRINNNSVGTSPAAFSPQDYFPVQQMTCCLR